ncbi:MAG: phage holin family protein [Phycisphaera sp. RhM]|nr:phage holin family protein [Phycisphaera sp. RhM]
MSTGYQTNGKSRVADSDNNDPRSLSDLIKELRDESVALVREEVALAKTEMSEKASVVGRNSALLIVGGAVAHLGLIFLLLAVSYGLYVAIGLAGLPIHALWIAPLIVGLVVGGIGLAMFAKAKQTLANFSPVPERTKQSLKEDKQWLQAKTK